MWARRFRWSLGAVTGVFVLAVVMGSDPPWLNAVWFLAWVSVIVCAVGWELERRRTRRLGG